MFLSLLKWLAAVVAVCVAGIAAGRLLFPFPDITQRQAEFAIPISADTRLGSRVLAGMSENPAKSGVAPIADGPAALASRLWLAGQANASIDAQYYIWHDDTSGRLLLKALHDAARRGVRVRLLLDDNGISGLDDTLSALDGMPNFHVRLFNPSTVRTPKLAGYALRFFRMNRRMHNKAFIVDGAAAIVGGRNIGDEYFRLGVDEFFIDLDVLAAGEVAARTAENFDLYWNSGAVHEIGNIVAPHYAPLPAFLSGEAPIGTEEEIAQLTDTAGIAARKFTQGELALEWVDAELFSDHPSKGLGQATGDQLVVNRLAEVIDKVEARLDLISAYFIPGRRGTEMLAGLAAKGANIRILTNAYLTTDVKLVHSGYAKYRKTLLLSGVELYELKPRSEPSGNGEEPGSPGLFAASLHAKTLAIDGKTVFIGSFNLDPRSALLNCEMGFLIDSPAIAKAVSDSFVQRVVPASYAVELDTGRLQWVEITEDGGETVNETEPGTGPVDRLVFWALRLLPIEWLL